MAALTIRISDELRKQLETLCRDQERSASDVVRESLRRYLAQEELRELRRELRPCAEAAGILTDEDVFKVVS